MIAVPDDCSRTYEILRPLGTGGFGTVFLAKHRQLGREVALKVLKHEMVLDQEQRQRFLDEARVTAQLADPHVVKVLDHGVADVPWIAYEYLPGRTVKDMLAAGPIRWRDAIAIAAQVAAALEAAHDKPDVDGTRNTGDKLAWAARQLEMLDAPRWGPFATLRTYTLLRLTHLEIEARQSTYRHLGSLDTASPELMAARRRGVAFVRALVDAGTASQEEVGLLVDYYMQMGRLVGDAADAAEKARLMKLADDMGRLFDAAPLNTKSKSRVARMRESLQSRR